MAVVAEAVIHPLVDPNAIRRTFVDESKIPGDREEGGTVEAWKSQPKLWASSKHAAWRGRSILGKGRFQLLGGSTQG